MMAFDDQPRPNLAAPRIVVSKVARKLQVFDGNLLIKTYRISLGSTPVGNKSKEGDGCTPEGEFYIFAKNPESKYHLSLAISYPGIDAATRGLKDGLISEEEHNAIVDAINMGKMPQQKTRLGGEIYLHGGGADTDWTRGCIAMADRDIQEVFDAIPVGTMVRIEP
ncbi:MAG TPA: L,D-transpeptidase [Pyrinomonadaceae bacterium]|jgi:murein L,D-transpeptidase YafK